ncbi:hypothetical protein [Granulicella sp. S190]|uniref:hypothetical protein n=1 Tax=Granulicella sp. S190 TaxID=1747226 RepID=UPI00131B2138|nr:hypothetical protein [Granulicella sp. S190]
MSLTKGTLLALTLSLPSLSHAQECFSNLPQSLRSTVEQDNWNILQPNDLPAADLQSWKVKHPGECPGITSGDFYPKGKPSYLVALIQRNGTDQNLTEKLTLVYLRKDAPASEIVVPPTQITSPMVVWKIHPGHYMGIDGTKASISRESFIYEKLAGPASQFYYDGTHLKSFIISR